MAILAVALAACGGDEHAEQGAEPPAGSPPVADAAPVAPPAEPPQPEPAPDSEPDPAAAASPGDDVAAPPPAGEADAGAVAPVEPAPPAFAVDEPELTPELAAMIDAADTIAGRTYAQRCAGCHEVDPATQGDAAAQIGPPLGDVVGRAIASVEGFDYSPAFVRMAETGAVWTPARLDIFLADPMAAVPGTAMSAGAVPSQQDRANVIAFLLELAGAEQDNVGDPELLALVAAANPGEGRTLASRCSGCHRYEPDAAPLIGPNLYDIVGAPVAGAEEFAYSPAMQALGGHGAVWTYSRLDAFLESPATAIPGTRMGFAGMADAGDRAAIIAFLRSLSPEPVPILAPTEGVGNEQAGLRPVAFDADQVRRGRLGYGELGCVACHSADLRGGIDMREEGFGVAPPLTGPNFTLRWYAGSVDALFSYLRAQKPPGDPGTYTAETYIDLIAYILSRNGFAPSDTALPVDQAALEEIGFFQ